MSNYKRDNKGYLKRGTCSTFRFEENTANSIVLKTVQFLQNLTPNLPEQINFQVVKFHDLDSFYLNQIINQSEMYCKYPNFVRIQVEKNSDPNYLVRILFERLISRYLI